jgi:hypothetical protein
MEPYTVDPFLAPVEGRSINLDWLGERVIKATVIGVTQESIMLYFPADKHVEILERRRRLN